MNQPQDALSPPGTNATEDLLRRSAEWQARVQQGLPWLRRSAGLAAAGTSLAREVLDVVQGMHGTIATAPGPLAQVPEGRTRGITRLVYDCIETGFSGAQKAMDALAAAFPEGADNNPQWLQVQAAINGVLGDRLERDGNPLALKMQLLPAAGTGPDLLVFAHGLCMAEPGWHSEAHDAFVATAAAQGHQVAYLRYNSGRHISHNGKDLAALLEDWTRNHAPGRIRLIGHSMGGLLIRSALQQAESAGHSWPGRTAHCVYLGSPHHGSPWERLGNHANRLLKLSPYTAPFMRLGDIRSDGIKDLRHGYLQAEEWQAQAAGDDTHNYSRPATLPAGMRHTLIAATRSERVPSAPVSALDDYLVPVDSALGQDRQGNINLSGDEVHRQLLPQTHHIALLHAPRVYEVLLEQLGLGSPHSA